MSTRKTLKEFEKIYKDTYNTTLKYVICKCSNLDDVNDIMQDIYMEFYKKLEEKRIEDEQAFIIGIARNKIKKYISSKNKMKITSIFQEDNSKETIIDIDSRNRYGNRIYK